MAAELHSETSQKSESRLKFVNYFRGKNSTLDVWLRLEYASWSTDHVKCFQEE